MVAAAADLLPGAFTGADISRAPSAGSGPRA